MPPIKDRGLLFVVITILFFSTIAFFINHSIYHYHGNQYMPDNAPSMGFSLLLIYGGCLLLFNRHSKWTQTIQEILLFFLTMAIICIATNATQYTPFPPIDHYLLSLETSLHIDMQSLMAWTYEQPWLKASLEWIYNSFSYQMAYIPLLVILTQRFHLLREYYFFLLTSTLIGFVFYYFFPTTAPASVINSPYFMAAQHATELKFTQIHQHLTPTTLEGGLIAFPSFHVIWIWFCSRLLREWKLIYRLTLAFNSILIASCVLLGWHYASDLVGSLAVILITHWIKTAANEIDLQRRVACRLADFTRNASEHEI